ncbi:MAG: hypothetical protein AAGA46_00530 [Cyanobacteria bacterium P01_F01_bin.13]
MPVTYKWSPGVVATRTQAQVAQTYLSQAFTTPNRDFVNAVYTLTLSGVDLLSTAPAEITFTPGDGTPPVAISAPYQVSHTYEPGTHKSFYTISFSDNSSFVQPLPVVVEQGATETYFSGDTSAGLLSSTIENLNAVVGEGYEGKLPWTDTKRFNVLEGPVGLTVGNQTGTIRWTPTPDQTGSHTIKITDGTDTLDLVANVTNAVISEDLSVAGWMAPSALKNGKGTYTASTKTFNYTNTFKAFRTDNKTDNYKSTVTTIYLRGGTYIYTKDKQPYGFIRTEDPLPSDTDTTPSMRLFVDDGETLVIKPWGNERVMFRGGVSGTMFRLEEDVKNVRFENIEWRGESKFATYEKVIPSWWQEEDQYNGNGIAVGGSYIEFRDCVLHEIMSQTLACKDSSNITIKDCCIVNAARWTISGTTGIGFVNMKASPDPVSAWSNQVDGCLIYGVESYLYSHVFSKNYVHLTIDEGEGLLAQPANQVSDTSNAYQGRTLFNNTALMHCGKGIVVNGQPRVDSIDCTIYETGTTITGRSKAMRNNKATENKWIRCVVNTVKGSGGEYGSAASFGEPSFWNGDTTYSHEGGGFLVQVPNDGQAWKLKDDSTLDSSKVYLLNYEATRNKNATPATLDLAEVALMVSRGVWIGPTLSNCYASINENDGNVSTGITYLSTVFSTLEDNSIELSDDVLNHANYPDSGAGADPAHIANLIARCESYSVNVSPPTFWERLSDTDADTGLNGYQQQTKDILEKAEDLGLVVDYTNWKDKLPYTDTDGKSHTEFSVKVTGTNTTSLASITKVNNQTELTLGIVHTYPRTGLAKLPDLPVPEFTGTHDVTLPDGDTMTMDFTTKQFSGADSLSDINNGVITLAVNREPSFSWTVPKTVEIRAQLKSDWLIFAPISGGVIEVTEGPENLLTDVSTPTEHGWQGTTGNNEFVFKIQSTTSFRFENTSTNGGGNIIEMHGIKFL